MSWSINRVFLVGSLGADPEVRTFQSGNKVVNLRLATRTSWMDPKTQQHRERVEWHNVALYAERDILAAQRFLRKGSTVAIEGALETRNWQDDRGQDRYVTEVTVRSLRGALTLLDHPLVTDQGHQDDTHFNRQPRPPAGFGEAHTNQVEQFSSRGFHEQDERPRNEARNCNRYAGYQRKGSGERGRVPSAAHS